MQTSQNRPFYGWNVLTALAAIAAVNQGGTYLGAAVVNAPMAKDLGLSRGTLGLASTVFVLSIALTARLVARMVNSLGARATLCTGSLLVALGSLLLATVARQGCHFVVKATVREGESWVGTSPRADIRIEAPGVRSRHLRIKRNGDRIFIEPLAGSAIVREGQMVEGFAPMAAGVPFLFGSVTATILRVEPRDYLNAVPIAVVSERPAAGLTTAEESSELRHLVCINAFLANIW